MKKLKRKKEKENERNKKRNPGIQEFGIQEFPAPRRPVGRQEIATKRDSCCENRQVPKPASGKDCHYFFQLTKPTYFDLPASQPAMSALRIPPFDFSRKEFAASSLSLHTERRLRSGSCKRKFQEPGEQEEQEQQVQEHEPLQELILPQEEEEEEPSAKYSPTSPCTPAGEQDPDPEPEQDQDQDQADAGYRYCPSSPHYDPDSPSSPGHIDEDYYHYSPTTPAYACPPCQEEY